MAKRVRCRLEVAAELGAVWSDPGRSVREDANSERGTGGTLLLLHLTHATGVYIG